MGWLQDFAANVKNCWWKLYQAEDYFYGTNFVRACHLYCLTLSSRRAYVRRHKNHRFWRGAYQRRPEEIGLFHKYIVCCPQ